MRDLASTACAIAALCVLGPGQARAGNISITFDEKQLSSNFDPLDQFYNGGKTSLGNGPGPNLGVTFTLNAVVDTSTNNFAGTFTNPGVMLLFSRTAGEAQSISATMDVQGGFGAFISFDYDNIGNAGTAQVYSGLDGQGQLLDTIKLPATSPANQNVTLFVADSDTFTGTAKSVVFTGNNNQIAFDDIVLGPVSPEPASSILLLTAGATAGAVWLVRRRRRVPIRCAAA